MTQSILKYSIMILSFILMMVLLNACGYRPSAKSAQNVMGDSISTEIFISLKDPENSVIIKDAIDRAVIEKFRTSLVDKRYSKTHLKINLKEVKFKAIAYDSFGYISTYQIRTSLEVIKESKDSTRTYKAKGYYDFNIEPNAVVSDLARFDAIRLSTQKAIDSFIAQVVAQGHKSVK
jgi:hypothetical protein